MLPLSIQTCSIGISNIYKNVDAIFVNGDCFYLQKAFRRRVIMGNDPGESAKVLLKIRRSHRLRRHEEQRIGKVEGFRLRHLRRSFER